MHGRAHGRTDGRTNPKQYGGIKINKLLYVNEQLKRIFKCAEPNVRIVHENQIERVMTTQ